MPAKPLPAPIEPAAANNDGATVEVSLREALGFWLKLGFISFGGPSGQIAIMHAELVERRRWISEQRFLHALNYCMLLPGPEAQQLATYLGWLMHKTRGGIAAGVLFVLPSLLILIALSWIYLAYGHTVLVTGLFAGIKPAVVAIVVHAIVRLGSRTLTQPTLWMVAAMAFVGMFALGLPFPLIILAAAAIGFVGSQLRPLAWSASTGHEPASKASPAVADTEPRATRPAHTIFSWMRLTQVLCAGAVLWLVPFAALTVYLGWAHSLTQMAWFFTKAALLTFGGAYAVLPYVYQGAVVEYSWLSAGQMMDGLALGETTPGPLIMVVAFVGFVGSYVQALFGPELRLLAGVVAACLVTWFTFLPSFIFILAGGPLVESTQTELRLTAPLKAITAAVVGVMAQLAWFFGQHTLLPQGLTGPVDFFAGAIAVLAAIALMRYKRGVIEVILACAALGLLGQLWS